MNTIIVLVLLSAIALYLILQLTRDSRAKEDAVTDLEEAITKLEVAKIEQLIKDTLKETMREKTR